MYLQELFFCVVLTWRCTYASQSACGGPGELSVASKFTVPSSAPSGSYEIRLVASNQAGAELFCIKATAAISKPVNDMVRVICSSYHRPTSFSFTTSCNRI